MVDYEPRMVDLEAFVAFEDSERGKRGGKTTGEQLQLMEERMVDLERGKRVVSEEEMAEEPGRRA